MYTEEKWKFNTLCIELDQDGWALEHYLVANDQRRKGTMALLNMLIPLGHEISMIFNLNRHETVKPLIIDTFIIQTSY